MITSFFETDIRVYTKAQGIISISRKNKAQELTAIRNRNGRWVCDQNGRDYTSLITNHLGLVSSLCADLGLEKFGVKHD